MDKQQARQIIKDVFESRFDRERYIRLLRELLNSFDNEGARVNQGARIPEKFQDHVEKIERVGKYTEEKIEIMLFIVYLKRETAIERARTMQRNFVAWYLSQGEKDAALVAYVSPDQTDWRFSLVKMDYTFEKSKTGKMKVKEEFTPARRWSFLVGANEKSHTAQSRLVDILADDEHAPTLAELEKAFDIETVTKEFFLKYRELFLRTKEALDKVVKKDPKIKSDFEAKGVDTVNFAKKLLGQIVFLYFLQKKGWFGVGRDDDWGTGSKHFLRSLFAKNHGDYQNFFNDILEPLFYDALSRDRSDIDHWNDQFKCKIPFLMVAYSILSATMTGCISTSTCPMTCFPIPVKPRRAMLATAFWMCLTATTLPCAKTSRWKRKWPSTRNCWARRMKSSTPSAPTTSLNSPVR